MPNEDMGGTILGGAPPPSKYRRDSTIAAWILVMFVLWWGWKLYELAHDKDDRYLYPSISDWQRDLEYALAGLIVAAAIIAVPICWPYYYPLVWWPWILGIEAALFITYTVVTLSSISRD